MLSNLSSPFDLALLVVGGIFLMKKLVEMDRYFGLRVVVLTAILSCAFVYYSLVLAPEYMFADFTANGDQF